MKYKQNNKYYNIPKTIWITWFQGIDNAPDVVKQCVSSWKRYHPTWDIIILDDENIHKYIDIETIITRNKSYIARTQLSDILRINLLAKYGGIWVDSTCYCNKPLEDWLAGYIKNDFFVFQPPVKSVPLSNWFIASSENSAITKVICDSINNYYSTNDFKNQYTTVGKFLNKIIQRILQRLDYNSLLFYITFNLSRMFKIYPYFCFHYVIGLTIKKYPEFQAMWSTIEYYNADIPHYLQHNGLLLPLSPNVKKHIDSKQAPLYKLTYKYDMIQYNENTALYYLLNKG